jgi:enoyl-CoA hydratase
MSALLPPEVSAEPPPCTWANVSVANGIAEVALVATGKASRQGPAFWLEAPALFAWLDASPLVRVVLLRGEGEGFSHGIDLMAMASDLGGVAAPGVGALERNKLFDLISRMQQATSSIARCKKPVVAAVHGHCIGAGVDITSACDVRLCSADAKFSVREVKLAIVADVGTLARLPAIIGQGATRELALTGDDFDAARALSLGFVSQVYDTPDALLVAARAMAGRIAENPPLTTQGVKRVLNAMSEPEAQRSLDYVATWNAAFLPSEDMAEAMMAFAARRPPSFRGK